MNPRLTLTIILSFLSISMGLLAQEVKRDSYISKFDIEEIKNADFVAYYSTNKKLDIGIGPSRDGVDHLIKFDLNELERFFDKQKHKNIIVLVIESHRLSNEKIKTHAKTLYDFFIARGYKKVIIQQGDGR